MSDIVIETRQITKTYASGSNSVHALRAIDLTVHRGEFIAVMGTSGSGKSTLMNVLGCLDTPTSGSYLLDGVQVESLDRNELAAIRNQKIGFVFQGFNLLARTSAVENVQLPLLYDRSGKKRDTHALAIAALVSVGLGERVEHEPSELSGGQQQRVAIARALATSPGLLLLDEPLSALDARVRVRLRGEIRSLQQRVGITTILVTHDQEEALSMADRIVVMNQGRIEQVGTPRVIYEMPATPFAADFVGKINVLSAVVEANGTCRVGGMSLAIARDDLPSGTAVKLYLRPEDIALSGNGAAMANTLPAKVAKIEFLGAFCMVGVHLDAPGAPPLVVNLPRQVVAEARLTPGAAVSICLPPAALRILG